MKEMLQNRMLKTVKAVSDHNVKGAISTRCVFFCYEPKAPKAIEKMKNKK